MLPFIFTIEGRLPGMNEIIATAQRNRYNYGAFKKKWTMICAQAIFATGRVKLSVPVELDIVWNEPNLRRDVDNIMAGTKFILDALVDRLVIPNDNQAFVKKITHSVKVNPRRPYIHVSVQPRENIPCPLESDTKDERLYKEVPSTTPQT